MYHKMKPTLGCGNADEATFGDDIWICDGRLVEYQFEATYCAGAH